MNCIDRTELEKYLQGKLSPERLLAVDEHISECDACRAAMGSISARYKSAANLSAALLGAADCPDYDELSAFVDNTLDRDRTRALIAHINCCELCARDTERIRELRSQAAMREKIVITPGVSRQPAISPFIFWKKLTGAATIAAAIAFMTISFGHFSKAPVGSGTTSVAQKPPVTHTQVNHPRPLIEKESAPKPEISKVAEKPTAPKASVVPAPSTLNSNKTVAVAPKVNNPKPRTNAEPAQVALLKDGPYRVDSDLKLEKANGSSARTELESKIATAIEEKLRYGKVKVDKPVQMAMATIRIRGEEGYVAPPTAPKQISPLAKIVIDTTPTFDWTNVELADSYRVRVLDEAGRVVAEQIVNNDSYTLDQPLERGKTYIWQVGVRFSESDNWANSAASRFAVLSNEDYETISSVRRQMPGSHLAMGVAYESAGLVDEANAEYRALAKSNPKSKLAKQLLQ